MLAVSSKRALAVLERLLDALNIATDSALVYAEIALDDIEQRIKDDPLDQEFPEALVRVQSDIAELQQIRAEFLQDYTQN